MARSICTLYVYFIPGNKFGCSLVSRLSGGGVVHDADRWSGNVRNRSAFQRVEGQAASGDHRRDQPVLASTLASYGINTRLRVAHFLGQTCHESAGFRTTEEFASGEAYEGRKDLGNIKKGDGPRYKGRGLIQLTGRANYKALGTTLGIDLESHPLMAAEPVLSLKIACEYWKKKKINPDCDRDDIITVTKKINGGTTNLDDRRRYTSKAKAALARVEGIQHSGAVPDPRPVLRRGSNTEAVGKLQAMLQKLGFPLAIDQDFGPATELR